MSNLIKEDTKIKRNKVDKRSTKQQEFRDALIQGGFDWDKPERDADHVRDLAFEGRDAFDNLWPLDRKRNQWAFTGQWYKRYGIEYRNIHEPLRSETGTVYTLRDKYFKVIGFETEPRKLGGKTDKWPSPDKP